MKYTICYLYYDLLNLYGDSGNVKALKNHLENQIQATFNCPTQSETQHHRGSPPIISKLDPQSL